MNTINIDIPAPLPSILKKLVLVVSAYMFFGLLLNNVYANIGNDPLRSQQGSVWLLPLTAPGDEAPDEQDSANDTETSSQHIYLNALQLGTDVDYQVIGPVARAMVKQQFTNNSEFWAEGIYVFPLPENAAVDSFKMRIGERVIEGRVKERVQAKKTYLQARSAGKKASLIEQQRPNVFTTSLANIAPGENISIEFEYQQTLTLKDGRYRLRFPMVVGPRYHPPRSNNEFGHTAPPLYETSVVTETDPVSSNNNPVHIHILLDAGTALRELDSSYHEIDIMQTSETRYSISTIGEQLVADRDFELVWRPELYEKPQLSAFSEEVDGEHYSMVMVYPPAIDTLQDKVPARDVIFVLDISGSMSGASIEQAKASLITALDNLTAVDRFNIIWFNDETGSLFARTTPASEKYRRYAKLYVEQLQADGGTEMLPALQRALYKQETFSRLRQVIFLTDGNISNETELFDVIDQQLGNSRLFTIGIGSAPNSHFMQKAAQRGRGTFTYIGDIAEVQNKTTTLLEKLETPALINLQLEIDGQRINNEHLISDQDRYELFPENIPDLYAGEPLTLVLKGKETPETITLHGDLNNTEWYTSVALDTVTHDGIRIAWARNKIASLMDQHRTAQLESDKQAIQSDITHTALKHHLVSRYTSLVAVDVTPSNTEGLLYQEKMKNNLPHGWTRSTQNKDVMLAQIRLPQTATSTRLNVFFAVMLLIVALGLRQLKKHTIAGSRHA